MSTGLPTASAAFPHSAGRSGACVIAASAGTSTGRGTRRRGKPGRPGVQAGRSGSLIRTLPEVFGPDEATRQGPGSRTEAPRRQVHGEPGRDRRTAQGSRPAERQRPGAARIQPTAIRVRPTGAQAKVLTLNGQVQPGLGEGARPTVRPGSRALAQFRRPPRRPARCTRRLSKTSPAF